jgi:hypothetical protein
LWSVPAGIVLHFGPRPFPSTFFQFTIPHGTSREAIEVTSQTAPTLPSNYLQTIWNR